MNRKINRMHCILIQGKIFFLLSVAVVFAQGPSVSDFTAISSEGYEAILQFYQYDTTIPLNVQVTKNNPKETREKIVFTGSNDKRVPGYLEIPEIGTKPCPCVLLLHGIGESKEVWWQSNSMSHLGELKKRLLESGFAVAALDAVYHGERIAENQYENPSNIIFQYGWFNKNRDMVLHSTIDYRRLLDYLATRPDIDMKRIGAMGCSMGGGMTFLLTAVDSRIKTSIACVTPPYSKSVFEFSKIPFSQENLQKFRRIAISPNNFAHAIGTRPFLMIMGLKDFWYTEDEANQLFDLIPGPTKELIWFDSGHILPIGFVLKALSWFQSHLE